ncbi:MAG: GNAT family N-acetyltransferase [Gemmatimonadaceae bacterium]
MTSAAMRLASRVPAEVRQATEADNRGLLALSASCSMRGDISLRFQREPDFFALSRLEGSDWSVDVIDAVDRIAGCVGTSIREVYINGQPTRTGYVGDLKVHPAHRDHGTADSLSNQAGYRMESLPDGSPALITVLAGNSAMEKRLSGERGLDRFHWLATIRSYSIPILWKRRAKRSRVYMVVERAKWSDIGAMVELWTRVGLTRQFAPLFDETTLADWIRSAPGLDISSYLLARSSNGELIGFMALWDQSSFKQMYVEKYSRKMAVVAALSNAIAPRVGGARLVAPGEQMRLQTVAHVCVPRERPDILEWLIVTAHNDVRHTGCAFFNVGLDIADPLSVAVEGMFGQPTDINAYVSTRKSILDLESLKRLPLHYEIALV